MSARRCGSLPEDRLVRRLADDVAAQQHGQFDADDLEALAAILGESGFDQDPRRLLLQPQPAHRQRPQFIGPQRRGDRRAVDQGSQRARHGTADAAIRDIIQPRLSGVDQPLQLLLGDDPRGGGGSRSWRCSP